MREVDDPHHPEHQRQPAGEQRVEAAEQDALDDALTQVTPAPPRVRRRPKYASVICSRVSSLPALEHDPALEHADDAARRPTSRASRSCSTRTIVVPACDQRLAASRRRPRRRSAPGRARPRRAAAARVAHQRAADRGRLLLAAREARRAPAAQRLADRERLEHRVERPPALPAGAAADAAGSPRRSSPGTAGGPRARARCPCATRSCARHARDVVAVEDDPAGRRPVRAGDRAQQRRLAGAVGADERHASRPPRRSKRHAAHRLQQAVAGVEPLDREQRSCATPPEIGVDHGGVAHHVVRARRRR